MIWEIWLHLQFYSFLLCATACSMFIALCYRPSVCPSHGWISQNSWRYIQSYIGSRICAFDWHQDRRRRMLLNCWIFWKFRGISQIWEATTAKRMKIDPHCPRQRCNPLNVPFAIMCLALIICRALTSALAGYLGFQLSVNAENNKVRQVNFCKKSVAILSSLDLDVIPWYYWKYYWKFQSELTTDEQWRDPLDQSLSTDLKDAWRSPKTLRVIFRLVPLSVLFFDHPV